MLESFVIPYDQSSIWYRIARVPDGSYSSAIIATHGAFAQSRQCCVYQLSSVGDRIIQIAGDNRSKYIMSAAESDGYVDFYVNCDYYSDGGDTWLSVISKDGYWEFGYDENGRNSYSEEEYGKYLYLGDPSITEKQAKNLKTFAVGKKIWIDSWTQRDNTYETTSNGLLDVEGCYVITIYDELNGNAYSGVLNIGETAVFGNYYTDCGGVKVAYFLGGKLVLVATGLGETDVAYLYVDARRIY